MLNQKFVTYAVTLPYALTYRTSAWQTSKHVEFLCFFQRRNIMAVRGQGQQSHLLQWSQAENHWQFCTLNSKACLRQTASEWEKKNIAGLSLNTHGMRTEGCKTCQCFSMVQIKWLDYIKIWWFMLYLWRSQLHAIHAGHAEFVFPKRRVCTFASGWAKNLRESCANSNRLTGELHKHKAAFLYWVRKMYHYLRRPSLQKCVFYITRTTHFTSLSACQSSSHPFFCFLFLIWPPGAPTQNCWCERINPGIHQICFAESWAASNVKIKTLLHSWGVFCVELWHIFPRTSWHFTPSTWIFCKHEKSMTISWSVSPLPFGDQFVQFEWGFLHLLVFGHFWLCHADAQRAKSHPAAGLRSPQPTHGILLGGGYILLEAEKLLKSAPLVDELKSHIMYLLDLSWCRTDWNHFPSQHNTCSIGKMVRHLATFHSSYVWYYTAIPFCACPNLLCPWSFGCCRAKLSILSQSVNHSMLSEKVIS